ncbi:SlyX family protein [Pseudomonadota bacterium]
MDEQLIDLQTRLAFQEDNIGEINRTLATQANEIRELRLEIDALKRQVRTLTPSNIASEAEETPPPHY